MLRLPTALARIPRTSGKYRSIAAGLLLPPDQTIFIARIARPNPIDAAWPDRGRGGIADPHPFDNDRVECRVGGLDTEVLRAYFFLSLDDGAVWVPLGHVGTTGGRLMNMQGDAVLDSFYQGWLPGVGLPNRRLQVVLDVREGLTTGVEIDVDDRVPPAIVRRDLHRSIAVTDTAGGGAGAVSSVSTSTNIDPTGSDRYLVGFGGQVTGTVEAYTSITFGAATLTQIFQDAAGLIAIASAASVAPSTTGALVTYTIAAASSDCIAVGAVSFSGVDQSTPKDAAPAVSSGTLTAPSHTVTAGDAGDVRIAGMMGSQFSSGAIVVGSGETSRVEQEALGSYTSAFGISTKEDGGSDAMNWTPASGAFGWAMRGFNINMASAGAAYGDIRAYSRGMKRGIRQRLHRRNG